MLKLLLRQLKKHQAGLIPVALVWILGGYFIFTYNDACLAMLSRMTVSLPEPGRQDPATAMEYIEAARETVEDDEIRLDLMAKLCNKHPLRWDDDRDLYQPHWLEKVRSWNLETKPGAAARVVEPDEYWAEHRSTVLDALRHAVDALALAYEITPADRGEPADQPTILVAAEVSRYARAVCRPQIAVLAWGDYVEFQEVRAFQRMTTESPALAEEYRFPMEQQLLVLESLRESPGYIRALQEYGAGEPALPRLGGTCADGNFRLPCAAPTEALKVLNKQLYFAPAAARSLLHLRLGRLHQSRARALNSREHLIKAVDQYSGATGTTATEEEARLNLARMYLYLADRAVDTDTEGRRLYFERAYDEIKQLSLISRGRGLTDDEFRDLARHTLIGLGRFRDADCFADLARPRQDTAGLVRPHCKDLRL